MARQLLKGLTMLMMIVGLALATAAVANGQSNNRAIANVPFDFISGSKECQSGKYDVRVINGADLMAIRSADRGNEVLAFTHPSNGALDAQTMNAKLVFHRYGNTYFLSQVWLAGENTGRELSQSRRERAIARELGKIASVRGDKNPLYEVVEIVAGR
jgi:hypothetical protein